MIQDIRPYTKYIESALSKATSLHTDLDLLYKTTCFSEVLFGQFQQEYEQVQQEYEQVQNRYYAILGNEDARCLFSVDYSILSQISQAVMGNLNDIERPSERRPFIEAFFAYEIQQIIINVSKTHGIELEFEKQVVALSEANVFIQTDSFYKFEIEVFHRGDTIGQIILCMPLHLVKESK